MKQFSGTAAFETRGLDEAIADGMGCQFRNGNFRFEYRSQDALSFTKVRTPDKRFWIEPPGVPLHLWQIDNLRGLTSRPRQPLVCTEGEFDCIAVRQTGADYVTSVPNGANGHKSEGAIYPGKDSGFQYLWGTDGRLISELDQFDKIVLATDGDEKGFLLRDELAIRIGQARCWFVEYPEGCKDANDVLLHYGAETLAKVIANAKPMRPGYLVKPSELPPRESIVTYSTGWGEFDRRVVLARPELLIVTGIPGHGKGQWIRGLAFRLAKAHGWRTAFFTPEDPHDRLTRDMKRFARSHFPDRQPKEWMDDHFRVSHPPEDERITLEMVTAEMTAAAFQHDCQVFVLDPWNEVSHDRGRRTDTEYVEEVLVDLKRKARRLGMVLVIVAHPKKIDGGKPGLYDISGCYSDDTEVLTRRGWLRHAEITHADDVACFDIATSDVIWHHPERIWRFDHDGEMHHYLGYGYDLLVTPEHRMLLWPDWREPKGTQSETGRGRPVRFEKGKWSFVKSADVPANPFLLPKAGNPTSGDYPEMILGMPSREFVRFLGWWIAEGCMQSSGLSLVQSIGEDEREIQALMDACGIHYSTAVHSPTKKGGKLYCRTWYIGSKKNAEVVAWVRKHCGDRSATRCIPDTIFELSCDLKRELLDAYLHGDGSQSNGDWRASTTSLVLRDQLQRLAVECGIPTTSSFRDSGKDNHARQYQINFGKDSRRSVALRIGRNRTITKYKGDVWCLTVPTGAYFVRRNGAVSVCGNSANWYNKCDHGIIVYRSTPDDDFVQVIVEKCKDHETMGTPGTAWMTFDRQTADYVVTDGGK